MGLVNTGIKSTPCVQWNILLYFWCCGPIFLLEVLFRHMASWIPSNTKSQYLTGAVKNLIMGHVWIFQPDNNPNTNLKNNTKMGHWAQNQASALAIPVLWPEPCRKWEVNWREEAPSWSWESEGSGVILDEETVWSPVRCSLTSSGIIGENLELLNWQMEGAVNCGQCVLDKNIYAIMISPLPPPL